jgi:D-3-phosphoglycerate dehydrogenase / 2-oxoglutarate reductase
VWERTCVAGDPRRIIAIVRSVIMGFVRVLIADTFEQSGLDALTTAELDLAYQPELKDDALAQAVASFSPDVLVVRSTSVTEPILAAGPLKLVVRAGAGYNTIDVRAASRRGIYVANCPGKNSIAVAELAFGLILSLDRRIPDNVAALRAGQWNKKDFSLARGLAGRTLGLVGLGQIGREMIPRARAFSMNVAAWSRGLTPERAKEIGVEYAASLEDLARASDIVSVHVALHSQTYRLVGEPFFDAMRAGAFFVNTSRAEVVDQSALARAVEQKQIRAALDVFANEPAAGKGLFEDDIVKLPDVYGTHHIGASTEQAQEAIAAETVRVVLSFRDTGKVPNVVNLAKATPAVCALIVRHLDRPGVLASVLDAIGAARINVQEMENVVFEGAAAAVARIHLETEPDAEVLERIRTSNANILEIGVVGRQEPRALRVR